MDMIEMPLVEMQALYEVMNTCAKFFRARDEMHVAENVGSSGFASNLEWNCSRLGTMISEGIANAAAEPKDAASRRQEVTS